MKLALDVSTNRKMIKPSTNDVILYNGKTWYVTTKEELFKEYDNHFASKIEECNAKIQEMNELKAELARQMLEYGQLIRDVVLAKGEQQ